MCGIYGTFNFHNQAVKLDAVRQATSTLRHRGPNDEGYLLVGQDRQIYSCSGKDTDPQLELPPISSFYDRSCDLALGFRRLSILDLSPSGHQPMPSLDRRFWIIYNGEIYNYLELRTELSACGFQFSSNSDTEVILAAYQHWGKDCLNHFNGMWAFAIWDHTRQTLFLSRDRFGIKPLYYHLEENGFTFASEIKALVGKHGTDFEAEDEAVYRYLSTGLLPGNKQGDTFFKNIRALPPGHRMSVDASGIEIERYWQLASCDNHAEPSLDDTVEQYREIFDSAVQIRLRSDVSIGSCLSGGLDSSSIVSTIHHLMTRQGFSSEQLGDMQQTFSAVYDSQGPYNERKYIDLLLQDLPVRKNLTLPTAEKLQDEIAQMVWYQEEPFPTTSIFAQWCVMQKTRQQGVTVLLDGQGADELMGGYRPYGRFFADFLRRWQFGRLLNEVLALQRLGGADAWKHLGTSFAYASPLLTGLLHRLQTGQQFDGSALNADFARSYRNSVALLPPATHSLDEHLRLIFEDSNLPDLLRYEDRNSMAFSVEARVPFLDYRLVELLFGAAAPWRMKQGWTKYLLRTAMSERLPQEITWRTDKVGFATPETLWMREWMQTSGLDVLKKERVVEEYIDLRQAQAQVDAWLQNQGKKPPVWRWLNLSMWLKQWQSA